MPASTIVSTRFHRAARDGLLDVVLQASSKDVNQKDELGMTPTMWAAFSGHSHVLRVLVSKGGALNKYDCLGNTSLHLASVNANTKCVAFICAMGADVWSLNIDKRTPRDMAAAHPKGESALRLLDATMGREIALDPKRCEYKRQRAKERAEKHLLAFQRITDEVKRKQLEEMRNLLERSAHPVEDDATSLSSSNASTTMSTLWAAVRNTNKRRASAESSVTSVASRSFNFGVGSVGSDGSRTIRPISGLAPSTEVLYSGGALGPRRGSVQSTGSSMTTESVTDAFDLAQRNQTGMVSVITPSDSDTEPDDEVFNTERRRSSLFDRPGFGNVAFRHSLTGLEGIPTTDSSNSNWIFKSSGDVTDSASNDELVTRQSFFDYDEEKTPLVSFLVAWGLGDLAPLLTPVFKDDLEALLLANDDELRVAGVVTGPRKKLLRAIDLHNQEVDSKPSPEDTRL